MVWGCTEYIYIYFDSGCDEASSKLSYPEVEGGRGDSAGHLIKGTSQPRYDAGALGCMHRDSHSGQDEEVFCELVFQSFK